MNEKLQYASMLEIPVSTCTVSVKEQKKKGEQAAGLQTSERGNG